jgi:hypothetical protein
MRAFKTSLIYHELVGLVQTCRVRETLSVLVRVTNRNDTQLIQRLTLIELNRFRRLLKRDKSQ